MSLLHAIAHEWAFSSWSEWFYMLIIIGSIVGFIYWLVQKYKQNNNNTTSKPDTTGKSTDTTDNNNNNNDTKASDSTSTFDFKWVWIGLGILGFLGMVATVYFLRKRYKGRKYVNDLTTIFPAQRQLVTNERDGIITENIKGDGNCFYYSLASILHPEKDMKEVEKLALDLKQDLADIEAIESDELKQHFATPRNWVSATSIQDRVIKYTKRPLEIINVDGKYIVRFGSDLKNEAIRIVLRNQDHFEPYVGGALDNFHVQEVPTS